jgi:anti-sigma regulatory factor (Ser/Thr protein kinase)
VTEQHGGASRADPLVRLAAALRAADSVRLIAVALHATLPGAADAIVSLGVLDPAENCVRFEFAGAVPAEFRDRYHVTSLDTPLVPIDVIKTGEPIVITDTLRLDQRYRHVVRETAGTVRSCVSQPLRGHDGTVIGSLGLLWPTPRQFSVAERKVLARTAELTQSALDRIGSAQREHRIAVEFCRHLLDLDRGSTAAVVAAVYQPAGEAMPVGGDWYQVVPLPGPGRIALSVGEVAGRGLPAAVTMSKLRAAVAASALTDSEPAAVLGALDRYAATVPAAHAASATYAVVETGLDDGVARLQYACAGAADPVLVVPGEAPVLLRDGRRAPVGAGRPGRDERHPSATRELPPGALVLLYTGGLIECPGEPRESGAARLLAAVAGCGADRSVGDLCTELLDRMAPPGGYVDDFALLAVRPCHSTERSFATVLPAGLDHLAEARKQLRGWLSGIGIAAHRSADMLLAIGEAVTNAVEHGSRRDTRSTVSIEAVLREDVVTATVSDSGRWAGDSSASLRDHRGGRGLKLINGLADRVDTLRAVEGTRTILRFDGAFRGRAANC